MANVSQIQIIVSKVLQYLFYELNSKKDKSYEINIRVGSEGYIPGYLVRIMVLSNICICISPHVMDDNSIGVIVNVFVGEYCVASTIGYKRDIVPNIDRFLKESLEKYIGDY